jgi:cell division protein FtsI (penicillin-binding protein 3)
VQLAVDLRVQHAVRDELIAARDKFKAVAAAGVITDVRTGEILSMVSVPDFDPNNPKEANDPTRINRLTTGVFEMGSTFKALTIAMGLDSGKFTLNSMLDARARCATASSTSATITRSAACSACRGVHLFVEHRHREGRARHGVEHHKWFLKKMGQLDRLTTELPRARCRWCRSAGASSTPSRSRSATASRSRRCRPPWRSAR